MTGTNHARTRAAALWLATLVFLASAATLAPGAGAATTAKTRRVSVSSAEVESTLGGDYPSISGAGRFAAFETDAPNLVKGDSNGEIDVFVRDLKKGTTERVSVRSSGAQGNSWSGYSAISANGRYVTFTSDASNLVKGDKNLAQDVFVHDRRTGKTTRVSLSSRGGEGNGDSAFSAISADGRFVAFDSAASNLVKHDGNTFTDLFVHDRKTGTTRLISVSSAGEQANADVNYLPPGTISTDGRFVSFESVASNLVGNDTNAVSDIFVRDRQKGTTRRVSVSSTGGEGNNGSSEPSISADGRYVAFESRATNLIGTDTNAASDVFVRDRKTGRTRRVSVSSAGTEANDYSANPSISADGRYVVFQSNASNLVKSDNNAFSDIFVRDRTRGDTRRVSVGNAGQEGNSGSTLPLISANGRFVVFQSGASNLVKGDNNARSDIFVRGPLG